MLTNIKISDAIADICKWWQRAGYVIFSITSGAVLLSDAPPPAFLFFFAMLLGGAMSLLLPFPNAKVLITAPTLLMFFGLLHHAIPASQSMWISGGIAATFFFLFDVAPKLYLENTLPSVSSTDA